jgi:GxxExxY protein
MPVLFEGERVDCGYRLDLFVDREVIVEVKSVEKVLPVHKAQVLTYLRLSQAKFAVLFNFNAVTLKSGLHTFVGYGHSVPSE